METLFSPSSLPRSPASNEQRVLRRKSTTKNRYLQPSSIQCLDILKSSRLSPNGLLKKKPTHIGNRFLGQYQCDQCTMKRWNVEIEMRISSSKAIDCPTFRRVLSAISQTEFPSNVSLTRSLVLLCFVCLTSLGILRQHARTFSIFGCGLCLIGLHVYKTTPTRRDFYEVN